MPWLYEPDEKPKRKHHWSRDYAGFVRVKGTYVGKCPNNISQQECVDLLNRGIAWNPDRWSKAYPKRIYNIRDGVVFRATPTVGGVSYHAFPEMRGQFPDDLEEMLLELADGLGCREDIKKWLRR